MNAALRGDGMQSARIRTAWKNKNRAVSPQEHAVALAAVAWRVALMAAKLLHQNAFAYDGDDDRNSDGDGDRDSNSDTGDRDRLAVIREYLYFLIHLADRHAAAQYDDRHRAQFITQLSHECRRHYRENERDLIAAPSPDAQFVDELNSRAASYAATKFADGEPGYQTFRALGMHIQSRMRDAQENKWVQDQIQSADGIDAVRVFTRALSALHASAHRPPAA